MTPHPWLAARTDPLASKTRGGGRKEEYLDIRYLRTWLEAILPTTRTVSLSAVFSPLAPLVEYVMCPECGNNDAVLLGEAHGRLLFECEVCHRIFHLYREEPDVDLSGRVLRLAEC